MPQDLSDVAQQPVPGPNAPSSGTYGEGAALDRLKQQLPLGGPPIGQGAGGPPPMPTPSATGMNPEGRPAGVSPPPGMPAVLLHPTQRPDVPVTSPLPQAPITPEQLAPEQAQTMTLMMLADPNTPGISQQTREWAQTLLRRMAVS